MDADGGGGAAPSPASHGHASGVSNRASTALAAVSVFLILLYLFWRFVWQYLKHERRGSGATSAAATATSSSSSTPAPSCPSRDGAGEAARRTPRATTTTSSLPVFVRVAATAAGFGAEKVDYAVCLAELRDDGEPAARLVPGCGHGFHAECIEAWFRVNSTCPLCRAAVQSAGEAPPRHCSSV